MDTCYLVKKHNLLETDRVKSEKPTYLKSGYIGLSSLLCSLRIASRIVANKELEEMDSLIREKLFNLINHDRFEQDQGVFNGKAGYLYTLLLLQTVFGQPDNHSDKYVPFGGIDYR